MIYDKMQIMNPATKIEDKNVAKSCMRFEAFVGVELVGDCVELDVV